MFEASFHSPVEREASRAVGIPSPPQLTQSYDKTLLLRIHLNVLELPRDTGTPEFCAYGEPSMQVEEQGWMDTKRFLHTCCWFIRIRLPNSSSNRKSQEFQRGGSRALTPSQGPPEHGVLCDYIGDMPKSWSCAQDGSRRENARDPRAYGRCQRLAQESVDS